MRVVRAAEDTLVDVMKIFGIDHDKPFIQKELRRASHDMMATMPEDGVVRKAFESAFAHVASSGSMMLAIAKMAVRETKFMVFVAKFKAD